MIDLKSGKILVTGGAGFIGSALVWELNQRGIDNILITDYLGNSEKWRNLVSLKYNDYLEADAFLGWLQGNPSDFDDVKVIFHLGACSSTTEKDASYLVRNNYEYTRLLALWAADKDIRFVYASSAATYGEGEQGMDDHMPNISDLKPLNMYGYSKQMFDLFAQKNGFLDKIVGLKFFNVYGPNEDHKDDMRSLVNKAFSQIQETGKVKLFKSHKKEYADGEQLRDFLYVKDAVKMAIHLAENEFANGIYNLGSGKSNSWITLATAIFSALGKKPNIEFIDMPEAIREKYQYFTEANTSKLKSTGYDQKLFTLQEAVADYVKKYLLHDSRLGND